MALHSLNPCCSRVNSVHLAPWMWLVKGERRVEKGYWARWSCWLASDNTLDLNFWAIEPEPECPSGWESGLVGQGPVGLCKTASL